VSTKVLVIGSGIVFAILLWLGVGYYLPHNASALLPNPPAHGMSLVIQVATPEAASPTNDLTGLKEALRRRADTLGFKIYWERLGPDRVRVVAPILTSERAERLGQALCRSGNLEFRLVHMDSKDILQSGTIPAGYRIFQHDLPPPPESGTAREELVVKAAPEEGLSGSVVKHAFVTRDNLGQPQIGFALTPEATPAFARVTRENVQRALAMIVDGKLLSAPVIRDPIETGEAVISGHFTDQEAFELTAALESPLPVPVVVVEAKQF
jgi:preprotein translocase subunit SecD